LVCFWCTSSHNRLLLEADHWENHFVQRGSLCVWSSRKIWSMSTNRNYQNLFQSSSGSVLSTHNNIPAVVDTFSYPITINFTSLNNAGSSFSTVFDHSYDRVLLPSPFILGSTIRERQVAGGFFTVASTGNTGNGTSNNTFSYVDLAGNTFNRRVDAAFNNITLDEQSGSLNQGPKTPLSSTHNAGTFAGARLPPGRGKDAH